MQVHYKWNKTVRNFKVRSIVLLREEKTKKKWPICRVTSIQRDRDGFVRSANALTGINASRNFEKEILERPTKKLVLLLETKKGNNTEQ